MSHFRKRPVVIEAEQFFANRHPYPAGVLFDMMECADGLDRPKRHRVETLEGEMAVSDGDWIITGVQGERYPCKPAIFAATYEAVTIEPNAVCLGDDGQVPT
jgi:hypothetical protein